MTWPNVWDAIEKRRIALAWKKKRLYDETGTSESTYRKMRSGVQVAREDKRRRIATALGWTPDSIDRILAGEEPVEVSQQQPDGDVPRQVAQLAEAHQETAETLAVLLGRFVALTDEVAALKRRVDGIEDQRVAR